MLGSRGGPSPPGETEPSRHYCKVLTWSSNFLVTAPAAVLAGDLVTGVLTATYGGYMAAILETWRLTTPDEWRMCGPLPPPCPRTEIDINQATVDGLPVLGGMGFYYEGGARILGVRMAPPPQDPHLYHFEKKEKKEKEEDDPDHVSSDPEGRKKSKRRERRGRSVVRYQRFGEHLSRRRRWPGKVRVCVCTSG